MAERFAVLGTAGHIDHGKTALVRLLTGVDTDRLKEEKERGISIDLGFAHLELPGGTSCGIVDVPGHERFVKNMLAGACGVDAMLLVIAADEGVMPQTREHLDILDLLQVKRGVVALTKIDLVEEEWLELVTETVREYLEKRGFGDFPLVPVSSRTGEGRDALLAELGRVLGQLEGRPAARSARLPVDRSFTVEGFGSVVTGTLWQGSVRPGDRFEILPGGAATRARNVEVHGETVEAARAGQRTAVALAGVSKAQVPRGSWLLEPGTLTASHMLDVRLQVLRESPRPVRHRQRVRFHLGASEILGRVVLLEGETLEPGQNGLAQLRLEEEAVADRGDRFVIRTYSPARAIAGGSVLLPVAPKRRRGSAAALEEIRREESGSPADRLLAALGKTEGGTSLDAAARASGMGVAEAAEAAGALRAAGKVEEVAGILIAAENLRAHAERAVEILTRSQAEFPLRWGTGRGELKSRLKGNLSAPVFDRILEGLVAAGRVTVRGDAVRAGDPELRLSPEDARRVDAVERALEEGGLTPPTLKELDARVGFPPLDCLEHLTFEGRAVKLTPDLFLSRIKFDLIPPWIESFFQEHAELSVGDQRERWGMSRKYSVPVLEYLDRQGWTRRAGDIRVKGRALASPAGPEAE